MGRSAMGRFRSRVQRLDQRGSTTFGTTVLAVTSTAVLFQIGTAGQSLQQNHRKGSYTVPTGLLLKWQWLESDGSNNTRLIVMSPKMQNVANPLVNAWQTWAGNEHFLRNPIGLMEMPEHKYLRVHYDKHEAIQAPSIRGDSFVYHNWYSKMHTAFIKFPPMVQKYTANTDAWPNCNSIWIALVSDSNIVPHPQIHLWGRLYFDT